MRSDFLGDCDEFEGLPEAINKSQFLVPRLSREQRKEAISGPIHLHGAEISDRLVDRLLNESGDARDDLPVLQHTLMRAWELWSQEEPNANNEKLPGNRDSDSIARQLFQAITETDAGNRCIRRPQKLNEITGIIHIDSTPVEPENRYFNQK